MSYRQVIGLQTLQQEVQDLKNRIQSMANEIGTLQSTSPIRGQSPHLSPKVSSISSYVSFSHIEDKDGHLSSHQVGYHQEIQPSICPQITKQMRWKKILFLHDFCIQY
jgi:hypothetical protein